MTNNKILDQDHISLKVAAVSIGVISLIIFILIALAIMGNNNRRNKIINLYTWQTNNHIQEHQQDFIYFFDTTFAQCNEELNQKKAMSFDPQRISDIICTSAQQQLSKMGVDRLTDSSAIAYAKVENQAYELIEASGKYNQKQTFSDNYYSHFGYGSNRDDLIKFFNENKSIPMWADYISYIGGKEVIVPVDIDKKRIGYIFRGVIE